MLGLYIKIKNEKSRMYRLILIYPIDHEANQAASHRNLPSIDYKTHINEPNKTMPN